MDISTTLLSSLNKTLTYHFSYDIRPNQNIEFKDIRHTLENKFMAENIQRICQSTLIFNIEFDSDFSKRGSQRKKFLQDFNNEFEQKVFFIISEILDNNDSYVIKNPNLSIEL